MSAWTPWKEGDDMPPAGFYWLTAPGPFGELDTFWDMLPPGRTWLHQGVIAFMKMDLPETIGIDKPPINYLLNSIPPTREGRPLPYGQR